MDEGDAVPLKQDPADLPPRPLSDVQLGGVVQHHVHVNIESEDDSLEAQVRPSLEPNADPLPVLEEAVHQQGRLDIGRSLDLLGTVIGHFFQDVV